MASAKDDYPARSSDIASLIRGKLAEADALDALSRNLVVEKSQRESFRLDRDAILEEVVVLQKRLDRAVEIEVEEARRVEADSKNPKNPGPTWKGLPNDNPFGEVLSGDQARALAKLDRQFGLGEPEPLVSFKDGVHALTSLPTPEQARQHAETLRRAGVR
jgi:hypothetical protein